MMNEDILIPLMFFVTVIVLVIGVPLVRSYTRRRESDALRPPPDSETNVRLARIEAAIETMAVEIERIAEGQRFTTKLLSEREASAHALPAATPVREVR